MGKCVNLIFLINFFFYYSKNITLFFIKLFNVVKILYNSLIPRKLILRFQWLIKQILLIPIIHDSWA